FRESRIKGSVSDAGAPDVRSCGARRYRSLRSYRFGRLFGGRRRQRHGEAAPLVQLTADLDRPAMRLGDPAHEAQSQAESPLRIRIRVRNLIESVEDMGQ